ncbi:MAG TPA: hypothetical protein PKD86_12405, partial [Gemmatales bacterium]|nr:hypothetical protein [Gemmatales bacterium]
MRQARWLAVALILSITSVAVGDGMAVTLDGLKSTTPADWKEARAMPPMQVQAFTLPRVEGDEADASLVVFFFGSGSGGSLEDNIKRWKGGGKPARGKSAAGAPKSGEVALAGGRGVFSQTRDDDIR